MSQAVATQQKELAGKYHPYPKYKDSGVEWLGDIPNEWLTIPVGRLFSRIKRTGHSEKELLSVYRDYGVIPKSSRDDNNNKESDDLAPYQLVRPNDLVMNKMKAWQGSIAVSEYEGIVSPAYFVYEPSNKLFELAHPRYVHYLLRNPIYITQYMSRSKGIRVNQWDLDPDEFKLIELLLPSKQEQSKIFEFLDYETARIDRLIAQQQRLIELLKEKRQAVISHAVTKGLNPNAPMKDSGVEWLGQVPEHWGVSPLKYKCEFSGGGTGIQIISATLMDEWREVANC
ncbi:restriction endonuclease subunit S [Aeromonas salmonicida]|uniref:restriction endonuclease subunit S n=1 Tax=Aeromonas salmonicida TaxID=645 RepID=UPI0035A5FC9D